MMQRSATSHHLLGQRLSTSKGRTGPGARYLRGTAATLSRWCGRGYRETVAKRRGLGAALGVTRRLITAARQRRDGSAQVVQVDRLLQKGVEILAAEVLLVESRHGNDRKKGLPRWMPSDSAGELDAVHVWHGEVGDDDVDAWRRVEVGQGSDRRSRTQDVGSARPQKRGQDLHGIVIVVHDEEGEASEKIHGRGSGHETSVRYAVCSAGQSRKPPIPRIAVHDRRVNRNSSVAAPSAYASSRRAVTIVSRLQLSH